MRKELNKINAFIPVGLLFVTFCFACTNVRERKEGDEISNDNAEIAELAKKQKIGIKLLELNSDTLVSISDGDLTWRPFGVDLRERDLQSAYGNIFDVRTLQVRSNDTIIIFTYDKSFIKIKRNLKPRLLSARIANAEIEVIYDIKIGMKKKEFFSKIFDNPNHTFLGRIKVFQNFDPPGEVIDQTFIFTDSALTEIIFKNPYLDAGK
jgi:hypothetical protein